MSNEQLKIIVVGEQGVGKTCMLAKYCTGIFDKKQGPTYGCDFNTKILEQDGKQYNLQLWDIAGQERQNSVSKIFFREGLGAVVCCDLKDQNSMLETLRWKEIIEQNYENPKDFPMLLVQNKCDEKENLGKLEEFQTPQYLENFAKDNGFIGSFQTSAKENINLDETFNTIIKAISKTEAYKKKMEGGNQGNFGKKLNPTKQQPVKKKKKLC